MMIRQSWRLIEPPGTVYQKHTREMNNKHRQKREDRPGGFRQHPTRVRFTQYASRAFPTATQQGLGTWDTDIDDRSRITYVICEQWFSASHRPCFLRVELSRARTCTSVVKRRAERRRHEAHAGPDVADYLTLGGETCVTGAHQHHSRPNQGASAFSTGKASILKD